MLNIESPGVEERLRSRLRRLAGQHENVDAELTAVLRTLDLYLQFLEHASDVPNAVYDREFVTATRCECRAIVAHSTRHLQPRLSAATLDAAARFVERQPPTLPGQDERRFSCNWQFPHAETWKVVMADLVNRADVRVLELGSWEGRSACWLLDHVLTHPTAHIVCADVFDGCEDVFDANTRGYGSKVVKLKGRIPDTLRGLPFASFDVVYADASSIATRELEDAVIGWRLVKVGGLLICDDYGGPPGWEPEVRRALDHFLAVYGPRAELVHQGFQLILRRKNAPGRVAPNALARHDVEQTLQRVP
jgi:predicted O-methyltransferase YrrM